MKMKMKMKMKMRERVKVSVSGFKMGGLILKGRESLRVLMRDYVIDQFG